MLIYWRVHQYPRSDSSKIENPIDESLSWVDRFNFLWWIQSNWWITNQLMNHCPTDESLTNWWITVLLFEPYRFVVGQTTDGLFLIDWIHWIPGIDTHGILKIGSYAHVPTLNFRISEKCIMFYLIAGLEHEFYDVPFSWEWNVIIPCLTNADIFQRGRSTTKQIMLPTRYRMFLMFPIYKVLNSTTFMVLHY